MPRGDRERNWAKMRRGRGDMKLFNCGRRLREVWRNDVAVQGEGIELKSFGMRRAKATSREAQFGVCLRRVEERQQGRPDDVEVALWSVRAVS